MFSPTFIILCTYNMYILSMFVRSRSQSPYHRDCNKSNMTGATNGAGTAYPFGAHEFPYRFLVGFVLLDL